MAAIKNGRFTEQVVPVSVPQRRGDPVVTTTDEGPREDTSLERLATLRPVFKDGGTVTAGNASSLNDGAAAVVIMSQEKASDWGFPPGSGGIPEGSPASTRPSTGSVQCPPWAKRWTRPR